MYCYFYDLGILYFHDLYNSLESTKSILNKPKRKRKFIWYTLITFDSLVECVNTVIHNTHVYFDHGCNCGL